MKKQKYFSGGGDSNKLVLCKNSKTIFTTNFYSKAKGSLRLLQISSISGFPAEKRGRRWPIEQPHIMLSIMQSSILLVGHYILKND